MLALEKGEMDVEEDGRAKSVTEVDRGGLIISCCSDIIWSSSEANIMDGDDGRVDGKDNAWPRCLWCGIPAEWGGPVRCPID